MGKKPGEPPDDTGNGNQGEQNQKRNTMIKDVVIINNKDKKAKDMNKPVTRKTTLHKIGTIVRKRFSNEHFYGYFEGEVIGYNEINGYYKIKYRDGDMEEYDAQDMKQYYKHQQQYSPTPKESKALTTSNIAEEDTGDTNKSDSDNTSDNKSNSDTDSDIAVSYTHLTLPTKSTV